MIICLKQLDEDGWFIEGTIQYVVSLVPSLQRKRNS